MNKYKYRLVEQEEGGEETSPRGKEKIVYDIKLIPLGSKITDVIAALEKIDNYGEYISNVRNVGTNNEELITIHFGPSQRFDKLGLETSFAKSGGNLESFKEIVSKTKQSKFLKILDKIFDTLSNNKGKFHPKTTNTAINNYLKSVTSKPKLLKWKVVGDTLVFPTNSNPTKEVTKKIIKTVMNNAKLDYDLDETESESMNELKKLVKEEILKFYKK